MTVNAIFFSRGKMPFILSDTLPTFNGTSAFSPSDFWEGGDREQLPNTTLFRKTLLLPPGIAITFAGNAGRIHEVANDISAMWRELPNQERCLEVAREKFRPEHFLGRGVRSISLGVRPYSDENNFNFFAHTTNGLRAESRLLGTCFSLGSGQEELIRFLSNYDNSFYKNEEVDQQSCFLLGCEAVSALNNKSMFSPWISRATWGGYIEAFSFSEEAGGFLALPPWLHLLELSPGVNERPRSGYSQNASYMIQLRAMRK